MLFRVIYPLSVLFEVYLDPRDNQKGIPPSGLPPESHDTLFAAIKQSYIQHLDLSHNNLNDQTVRRVESKHISIVIQTIVRTVRKV